VQLKEVITQETGIPVEIDPRVYSDPEERGGGAPPVQVPPGAGPSGFPFLGRQAAGGAQPPGVTSITPNFHGTCEEVFDQIASSFDLAWRMNGRTLSFDKYVTRTIIFRVSDASTKSQASLSSGGNNASSGEVAPEEEGVAQAVEAQAAHREEIQRRLPATRSPAMSGPKSKMA